MHQLHTGYNIRLYKYEFLKSSLNFLNSSVVLIKDNIIRSLCSNVLSKSGMHNNMREHHLSLRRLLSHDKNLYVSRSTDFLYLSNLIKTVFIIISSQMVVNVYKSF